VTTRPPDQHGEDASASAVNSWAPLRSAVFRALWIAVLVSNIGNWMQTVGAQWLLVNQAHAAILVALVQVADTLPDALFELVGGVLADIFDRRRLLLLVQIGFGGFEKDDGQCHWPRRRCLTSGQVEPIISPAW